jgi:hypothetical protein
MILNKKIERERERERKQKEKNIFILLFQTYKTHKYVEHNSKSA